MVAKGNGCLRAQARLAAIIIVVVIALVGVVWKQVDAMERRVRANEIGRARMEEKFDAIHDALEKIHTELERLKPH